MMDDNIVSYTFTGWVYDVTDGKYGLDLKCKTVKDESELKWAQHISFTVGSKSKNYDKIKSLGIGMADKIEVTFIPNLVEGVSKSTNKAYAMMKNNITDAKIIEKASPEEASTGEPDPEDIPF